MQVYSLGLRTRVAAACHAAGSHQEQVAQRFGVNVSFIRKLLRREQVTGSLAAKPVHGGPARTLAEDQAWLVAYMSQHADATLAELG